MTADTRSNQLSYELQGVIADVKHGNGFDAVCLATIERVAAALQGRAQEGEPSDAVRKDAMRYRWMRSASADFRPLCNFAGEMLDEMIDEAIERDAARAGGEGS